MSSIQSFNSLPKKIRMTAHTKIVRFLRKQGYEAQGWRLCAATLEQIAGLSNDQNESAKTRVLRALKKLGWTDVLFAPAVGFIRSKASYQRQSAYNHTARFYESYDWRKLRYQVLEHYGRICMCCGTTHGTIHVDHIKPIRKYWALRLDFDNLQVLCEECNHGKGNWSETDFRPRARSYGTFLDERKALLAAMRERFEKRKSVAK